MARVKLRPAAALVVVGLIAGAAQAQQAVDNRFEFRPGDRLRVVSKFNAHPPNTFEVRSCQNLADPRRYSCEVFWVELNKTIEATWSQYGPDAYDLTLLSRGPAPAPAPRPAANAPAAPARPATTVAQARPAPVPAAPAAAGAACPAMLKSEARAPAFNATVARWAIAQNYYIRAHQQGISSPISVGVSFESLTVGGSEPNAVLNDPGRGAYLRNDAAPRGATLYSVQSVYRVCDVYSNGPVVRRFQARHVCFKGKTGEWGCGVDGFPQSQRIN